MLRKLKHLAPNFDTVISMNDKSIKKMSLTIEIYVYEYKQYFKQINKGNGSDFIPKKFI